MAKTSAFATIIAILSMGPIVAMACPEGTVPVGGGNSGWQGCAPIPGYGAGGQASSGPAPKWASRWGAIAIGMGANGSTLGASAGMKNRRNAEKDAMKQCKAQGGGNSCRIEITYHNQCGVIAWGDNYYHIIRAPTERQATELALEYCSRKTNNCRVFHADCSYPVRVR